MTESTTGRIEHELMDEPHIAGRRISVLRINDLVKDGEDSPETVADTFDLDLADIYHALAYYYEHPDEMAAIREHQDAVIDDLAERSLAPEEAAR